MNSARGQTVETERPKFLASSSFQDIAAAPVEAPDLNAMTISFYRCGVVKEVSRVDEFGQRQGWSVIYAPLSTGRGRQILAAQQFRDDVPHGAHFFWKGTFGGGPTPYSYGVWIDGIPQRGVFKNARDGYAVLSNPQSYVVSDAPLKMIRLSSDGSRAHLGESEYDSIDEIRSDTELLTAFKNLRGVAEYCSDLEVRKPTTPRRIP